MMVYFLQSARGGPVKIGFSADVSKRIRQLQGMYGVTLTLLAAIEGDREREREMHDRFAHLRIEGTEQFRPAADLMEFLGHPVHADANPDEVDAMCLPKGKVGRFQVCLSNEENILIDRIAKALSPDYPPSRSVVVRLAIREAARRRLLLDPS
jgi:hypothetical protein